MISEFERFCLTHVCAIWTRGRDNYCPIAERIRAKGGIIGTSACQREFAEYKREEKHELRVQR